MSKNGTNVVSGNINDSEPSKNCTSINVKSSEILIFTPYLKLVLISVCSGKPKSFLYDRLLHVSCIDIYHLLVSLCSVIKNCDF